MSLERPGDTVTLVDDKVTATSRSDDSAAKQALYSYAAGRPLPMKPLYTEIKRRPTRFSKTDYRRTLKRGATAFAGGAALSFLSALGYYALPTIAAPILL